MTTLVPQSFETLLRRMLVEHEQKGGIFDLEARELWRGPSAGFDLSIENHGAVASSGVGPAAGPHAQLAQNIVLSWLGGSRVIELKTVQVLDRLEIPRPCIDAQNIGFNVEWSQELTLDESLREYVNGWYLIHVAADLLKMPASANKTQLEVSVGYSLDGIKSDTVRPWLHQLRHARALLDRARDELPAHLRARIAHIDVPDVPYDTITLSTFHGCPAGEIERIAEHLLIEHAANVIVKMNPTFLGFDRVNDLLRGTLGYDDLTVHKSAFDGDLTEGEAITMMGRLEALAESRGLRVGAKFTNTLVVANHKTFFPTSQKEMYLSGPPLHVLAVQAAARFAEATDGRFQLSFSGGIDKTNFAEAIACGFVPVTTCTDLLRPGGYARLPKYLKELEIAMVAVNATNVREFIEKKALINGESATNPALTNLIAYSKRVVDDPRYASPKNRKVPRRVGTHLALFDCITCDKCVQVCPNDANFSVAIMPGAFDAPELVARDGAVSIVASAAPYVVKRDRQFASFADFCNDCGNCDVFCPEEGGPYKVKPRFFGDVRSFEADPKDGFAFEKDSRGVVTMHGRIDGLRHRLVLDRDAKRATFSDGSIECEIDLETHVVANTRMTSDAESEHVLPLWRYHAMRLLADGALVGVNPVSARWLEPAVTTTT
jgi:putative selenate reductase